MASNKVLVLVALLLLALATSTLAIDGCNQDGAYNETEFKKLYDTVKAESNELVREDTLEAAVASSPKGFTAKQTVQLLGLFSNELVAEDVIANISAHILGITCDDAVTILMTYPNELVRLDVLKVIVNLTIDLDVHNQTILKAFENEFNKEDAQKIIDKAVPRSCIWGDVTAKRLIFVVDRSGSMSTQFSDGGKVYTRLEFVAKQLNDVIRKALRPDQEFNVISFSDSPNAWEPGVVPVTQKNIDSAVDFVSAMTPSGSTAMLSALQLAFQDPKALAIYLLTDGQPNGSTESILDACKQWSNKANPQHPINAIAFMAGGTYDPKAAAFMKQVAEVTGGVYRAIS